MSDLAQLISLATAAASGSGPITQEMQAIEEYFEAFELWQAAHLEQAQADASAVTKANLKRLAELHPLVISRAQVLLKTTAGEMKRLQRHGKGIRAYTDTLPKQISVTGKRKG